MNKPIIGAIAAALALCASTGPVIAKTRPIAPPPPKPCEIAETPSGFVIRERNTTVLASTMTPASIRIGASVRLDAALLHGDTRESTDAQP